MNPREERHENDHQHEDEQRRRRRNEQQNSRRLRKKPCSNSNGDHPADQMIDLGSHRLPMCKDCLTLLQAGRNLPADSEAKPFIEVGLILMKQDLPYEFDLADYMGTLRRCYSIILGILQPAKAEPTEEEEDRLSVKEAEAIEEYLRHRLG